MGGFSLWHWLVVLVVIGALVVGVVIWLIARASRQSKNATTARTPPLAQSQPASARLQELTNLKSAGLLTETEFERKRAEILESV